MTKASDNAFPSILITEGTEPSAPAAGKQRIYIDSTTHLLKATNSSGTDRTIEGAAAGAVTSSGLTMATARILGRTTASTGAIEEITVGSGLTLSAGSLTATSGATFVGAKVYMAGTQSIGNNSETAVTFDTEEYDTDAFHSTVSNTSRFTIPSGKDGKYRLGASIQFAANGTGQRVLYWKKTVSGPTTSYLRGGKTQYAANGSFTLGFPDIVDVELAAGDYVEVYAYQNSGGSLNIGHATNEWEQSTAWIQFLGA